MSEQQLQFSIVTEFHNRNPRHRGMLLEINNNTNKGAYRKGMGMVKGASDLLYISPNGVAYTFELKAHGSRHEVKHLKLQLYWAMKVRSRGRSLSFFIFNKDQFFSIMDLIHAREGVHREIGLELMKKSHDSLKYIDELTLNTITKTVQINYVS